ncbi:protein-glutamate methylesterase/protein-glutamine glutaminase [Azorhizobium oxalatiphilum]|nr:chemotaxis response regulator protein-glutamate methylesterase [Azorhizobium oxalatiphilum]
MSSPAPAGEPAHVEDPIRVMIVDDSVFIRGILSNWLSESADLRVVATHANGRRAVDDVLKSQPDVIILDLEMPEMDGLTALPLILEKKPNTVVLVASTLTRRGAEVSMKAMSLGAADYVPKPDAGRGISAADEFRRDLTAKVRSLGQRVRRRGGLPRVTAAAAAAAHAAPAAAPASVRPVAERSAVERAAPATSALLQKKVNDKRRPYSMAPVSILAVGSSTGGPQALTRLFTDIGPNIGSVPVVIVQHMPATFTAILAEHVGRAAGRPAAEGVDGEVLKPGHIYIAPGGKHMLLEKVGADKVIRLNDGPPVNFCKPAVDPMFDTVAELYGRNVLSVVLTGMGSDGAKGAGRIADAGGSVIAQDEETSVVWGMPGATVQLGNASEVLSIGEIGRKVSRLLTGGRA